MHIDHKILKDHSNTSYFKFALILICILCAAGKLMSQSITLVQENKQTSIRGLSVVNDKVAWVSGSKGYTAITVDSGRSWNWQQVKGFEKSDFRDIEAFSDKEAIIMSSGTPALVLKTMDGGSSWQVKYRTGDSAYFFDAMDFDDHKHGYILGDPIKNKFLLMETKDSGETWSSSANSPDALPGEAAFAASGTCLRLEDSWLYIVSGGVHCRMITLPRNKTEWEYANLPITHGLQSEGAFSLAIGQNQGILVGGDYAKDSKTDSVAVIHTVHPFLNFAFPKSGPAGFQSSVEYISGKTFLSTGTPGTNITTDGGKTWSKIDNVSYNVCRKAKHGKLVLLAGNGGKIATFKL